MKYILKESQQKNLLITFNKLMNSTPYEGVCHIWVDYDKLADSYVLNVFFSKDYLVNHIKEKTTWFIRTTINQVGKKFFDFTGIKPTLYQQIEDC